MKHLWKVLGLVALVGIVVLIIRAVRSREESVFVSSPAGGGASTGGSGSGTKRKISTELLEILADPSDKGPVELLEVDGKEWLVNRRNGYRYPVEDGIPIMLIEEGEKNKDEKLIK